MTENEERILHLNAALDSELDAMSALELERAMRDDPTLAAEYRRLTALRDAVRRHAPRDAAPENSPIGSPRSPSRSRLQRPRRSQPSCRSAPDFQRRAPARTCRIDRSLRLRRGGAGLMSLRTQSAAAGVAAGLVADYARAAIAGAPYDVASSDRHKVKPWLAGRTTVSAAIVDLAEKGFPLAGGRIAIVDRIPAPTLVYRHGEHLIAVTELPLDARGARASGTETIDGYHVAGWSDTNLAFVAVSDMDEKTLEEFVAAFRQARKPAEER